jgi:hypothetical protein
VDWLGNCRTALKHVRSVPRVVVVDEVLQYNKHMPALVYLISGLSIATPDLLAVNVLVHKKTENSNRSLILRRVLVRAAGLWFSVSQKLQ